MTHMPIHRRTLRRHTGVATSPWSVALGLIVMLSCPESNAQAQDVSAHSASVVKISAVEDGRRKTGAGFVVHIDADAAFIVTARHVVVGDRHPQVRFCAERNRAVTAEAIAMDEHLDVALIAVRGRNNLPRSVEALPIAVEKTLRAGDKVLALGFPGGAGDWANIRASITGRKGVLLTLSGATDSGSSGGPVVKDGRAVGIITAREQVYSLAVPARMLRELLETWGVKVAHPGPPRGPIMGATRLTTLSGHAEAIRALAFSPGGEWLASAGAEGNVFLWSAGKDWRPRQVLDHGPQAFSLVFESEGDLLLSAHKQQVSRWSVRASQRVPSGALDATVSPSPDCRTLAEFGADGLITLRDSLTGEPLGDPLSKHSTQIVNLEFNRTGSLLASASVDGEVNLWNVERRELVATLNERSQYANDAMWIQFSHDSKRIAWTLNGTIALWDVDQRREIDVLHANGSISLRDSVSLEQIGPPLIFTHEEAYSAEPFAFSPDGRLLATGGKRGEAGFWDVEKRTHLGAFMASDDDSYVSSVAFSPDGERLAIGQGDGWVKVRRLRDMNIVLEAQLGKGAALAAFAPDGKFLMAFARDKIATWRIEAEQFTQAQSTDWGLISNQFAISPDGETLALVRNWSGVGGTLELRSRTSGRQVGHVEVEGDEFRPGIINMFASSPDGRLLATAHTDGSVRLWDPATRQSIGRPLVRHHPNPHGASSVAFSPDGRRLVSAGVSRNTA